MDELQISGKRFISAKRIAKENGYTADYVGQLIRGGKVSGQKVGRAWYVDAASFDAYLGTETPTQLAQEKVLGSPVSAKTQDAGRPDYFPEQVASTQEPTSEVGQPVEVVESVVESAPVAEDAPVEVVEEVVNAETAEEPVMVVPLRVEEPTIIEIKKQPVKVTGLRYYQEDEPVLPEIRKNKSESRVSDVHVMSPVREVAEQETVFVASAPARRRKLPAFALAAFAVAIFAASAWLSSAVALNLTITEGNAATAAYGIAK